MSCYTGGMSWLVRRVVRSSYFSRSHQAEETVISCFRLIFLDSVGQVLKGGEGGSGQ